MTAGPDVGAIVGCVDQAGRVLVVKQRGGPFAGAWLLPGGAVARFERVEDGARRELREETGYAVDDLRLVAVYEVRGLASRFHILLHMFKGGEVVGSARPEAASDVRWSLPTEIELHPVLAVELADLGVVERDPAELFRDAARSGIEMRRLL